MNSWECFREAVQTGKSYVEVCSQQEEEKAMKDLGRIDYKPRTGQWAVIIYKGKRDIEVARAADKATATCILQAAIAHHK